MNRRNLRSPLLAGLFLFLTTLLAPSEAGAREREAYSLELLVDGVPLPEYRTLDATYVEALEGREYSIRLTNRTGERVAIALSVDGLNSIDAKTTTARKASKWILGPWETITLDGWQTSSQTARRFFFTTEEDSYGAWLGKTKNLGIISAAIFREKRPLPRHTTQYGPEPSAPGERFDAGSADRQREGAEERSNAAQRQMHDDYAATGIGRELEHDVRRVHFETQDQPAAVIDLRYEYHDALVRLGVLPRPWIGREDRLRRRERARGFEDTGFAPDPHRSQR